MMPTSTQQGQVVMETSLLLLLLPVGWISGCFSLCVNYVIMPPGPDPREGAISVDFVRPSVSLSIAYVANTSRTQRPSVPRFGRKVPNLRCDSHTSFKVKRSKVRVGGGRGHTVSAEPGGHTLVADSVDTNTDFHVVFDVLQ